MKIFSIVLMNLELELSYLNLKIIFDRKLIKKCPMEVVRREHNAPLKTEEGSRLEERSVFGGAFCSLLATSTGHFFISFLSNLILRSGCAFSKFGFIRVVKFEYRLSKCYLLKTENDCLIYQSNAILQSNQCFSMPNQNTA